jgi:hypothetical protein
MKIGFWKSQDKSYGYLSSPIGFRNGKPCRIRLIKNKFANAEKNRPTYIGFIDDDCTFNEELFEGTEFEMKPQPYYDEEDDTYYDEEGNRLYTAEEVQHCINRAAADGARGYSGYGDNIIEDYI